MTRLVSYGTYVPVHRLDRRDLGGGSGTRSVASYDEDTTSLGTEAARRALAAAPDHRPAVLTFATTRPAYADRTNATAIHAALALDPSVRAYDMVGSVRSATGALRAAADAARPGEPALAVLSDIRVGLPGSPDERDGGDAGAALLFAAEGPCLAELVAHRGITGEVLDRWRTPGEPVSRLWEERFGEQALAPLAERAFGEASKAAGIAPGDVDQVVVTGTHARAVAAVRRRLGLPDHVLATDRSDALGVTGAAHPALLLADALERSAPGDVVALLVVADGGECLVFRAGELAGSFAPVLRVDEQLAGRPVAHQDALVWRGLLRRDPPRRPDPERPAAPAALRNAGWKFGFVAGRCAACGTRHLPVERICLGCGALDGMEPEPLAGLRGTITTFAVDRLAFSVAPPVVVAVVDFDGGGRLQCEMTDVDPASVAVGDRVELTFRRLFTTAEGIHNYFWKVRPLRRATDGEA